MAPSLYRPASPSLKKAFARHTKASPLLRPGSRLPVLETVAAALARAATTTSTTVSGRRSLPVLLRSHATAQLDYDHCQKYFQDDLTEILQDNLSENLTENDARRLAHQCALDEQDAVDKVNQILGGIGLDSDTFLNPTKMDLDTILFRAKARKAEELIQDYVQRKPTAIKLVDKLLAGANSSIDALMVGELPGALDNIERIDRLITIAEGRRNGMLREIDRRRAVLGEALRRKVQEVEAEFEVVDKTPEAKNAA